MSEPMSHDEPDVRASRYVLGEMSEADAAREARILGALIEKESCISLEHRTCWSTAARLKTSREEGAGLGQITRAWDASGALRFDALAETVAMDPRALQELNWGNVYTRADLVFVDGAITWDRSDPSRRPVVDFELGQPGEGDVK